MNAQAFSSLKEIRICYILCLLCYYTYLICFAEYNTVAQQIKRQPEYSMATLKRKSRLKIKNINNNNTQNMKNGNRKRKQKDISDYGKTRKFKSPKKENNASTKLQDCNDESYDEVPTATTSEGLGTHQNTSRLEQTPSKINKEVICSCANRNKCMTKKCICRSNVEPCSENCQCSKETCTNNVRY